MAEGNGVNRWAWLLNVLIPAVTGAITAYAAVQVNSVRITELEAQLKEHRLLAGHPGISQRIDGLMREHDKHEQLDYMFHTMIQNNLAELEKRMRDCELGLKKGTYLPMHNLNMTWLADEALQSSEDEK